MKRAFAAAMLIVACCVVFTRATENANLVKELGWLFGLGLLLTSCGVAPVRMGLDGFFGTVAGFVVRHRAASMACALWLAVLAVQAVRSADPPAGWLAAGRTAVFFATFASVLWLFRGTRSAVARGALVAGGTICCIYILMQFFGIDFLSWDDERRPIGTFANPNFSANFLAAVFPLALAWEAGRLRPFRAINALPYRVPVLAALFCAAILATQSRSGFVGLVAATVILALLMLTHRGVVGGGSAGRPVVLRTILVVILVVEIVAGAAWMFLRDKLSHAFSSVTIQLRLLLWQGSVDLWRERPFLGWGTGSFDVVSQRIKYLPEPLSPGRDPRHAHNWLLEMLVEQGLAGTLLWLVLLALLGWPLVRYIRGCDPVRALWIAAPLAGAGGLLAATLADVWLNWWDGGWLLWLLLAMAFAAAMPPAAPLPPRAPASPLVRMGFAAAGALVCALSVSFGLSAVCEHTTRRALSAKDLDAARSSIELAAALPAHGRAVPLLRGVVELESGRFDRARELSGHAERLQPGRARISALAAMIAFRSRDMVASEAYRREAWDREPSAQRAIELANLLLYLGRIDDAEQVLETQLARAAAPILLHRYLEVHHRTGRTRHARDFIAELRARPAGLLTKASTHADLARWEAELSTLLGDWGLALPAYRTALRHAPGNYQLWNDYGLALRRVGSEERAYSALMHAVNLAPAGDPHPRLNALDLAVARSDDETTRRLVEQLRGVPLPPGAAEKVQALVSGLE